MDRRVGDAPGRWPLGRLPGRRVGRDSVEAGTLYGFGAYLIWGAMPLYFHVLAPSGAWEILAHRILWSLVFCTVLQAVRRRPLPGWRRPARENVGIVLAGLLIASNWTAYLVAVTSGHVTEAALGYFLTPLVSVALGLVFLGERLRRLQTAAVAVGAAGGLFLALNTGSVPWIAFLLAFSFGVYGLVKKRMGVGLGAVEGLTAETFVLAPIALGVVLWLHVSGMSTAASHGVGHAALLASTGVVTAIPLLLFAMAAHRVPLVTIGLLQFISPVLQFITGLAMGEPMGTARWIGFGIVWVALLLLVTDSVRRLRRAPAVDGR